MRCQEQSRAGRSDRAEARRRRERLARAHGGASGRANARGGKERRAPARHEGRCDPSLGEERRDLRGPRITDAHCGRRDRKVRRRLGWRSARRRDEGGDRRRARILPDRRGDDRLGELPLPPRPHARFGRVPAPRGRASARAAERVRREGVRGEAVRPEPAHGDSVTDVRFPEESADMTTRAAESSSDRKAGASGPPLTFPASTAETSRSACLSV